ncbi:DUF4333 domain-containing protein [Alkalinema sp. FACHB-956]|uniref:DUF4333 domain-containing protein n=1 Tax=Alkalinema sp. FACHB-956 TaxID=2692768 RepID=UPI001F5593B2|nr:DUF4333 domain-containing protein [Alkalinema sp. FACHB-956]
MVSRQKASFFPVRFSLTGLLGLLAGSLVGCNAPLDVAQVEKTIQQKLVQQGAGSVKAVICPEGLQSKEGQTFTCTAMFESGNGADMEVRQTDREGQVSWEIPSVKGLVNLAQVHQVIQEGLKADLGEVTVDCGAITPYRTVNPGDQFDCTVTRQSQAQTPELAASELPSAPQSAASPKNLQNDRSIKEPEKVAVTIAPSGDINWQRLLSPMTPQAQGNQPKETKETKSTPDSSTATQAPDRATTATPPSQVIIPETPEDYDS